MLNYTHIPYRPILPRYILYCKWLHFCSAVYQYGNVNYAFWDDVFISFVLAHFKINIYFLTRHKKLLFITTLMVKPSWTLATITFASSFDDLREDVLGDVFTVLHGHLPLMNPLSSSCAQQRASFPHFIHEWSVPWIQLEIQDFRLWHSLQYFHQTNSIQASKEVLPKKRSLWHGTPSLSDKALWLEGKV